MLDPLDARIIGALLLVFAVVAAIVLVILYRSARQKPKPDDGITPTSEWKPTGKIDFYCAATPKDDQAPAPFLLRVEDYRTVESISGVEHMEIRWRNATLAEAKAVVVVHQNATDAEAKGYRLPGQAEPAAANRPEEAQRSPE